MITKNKYGCWVCLAVLSGVLSVAKLLGVLSWSWAWVLAPVWVPAALVVLLVSTVLVWALFQGGVAK